MLPSRRSALLFAAKFGVLFALLIVPWRWLGAVYSLGFSLVSTVALEAVVDEHDFRVRFAPLDSDTDPHPGEEWSVVFSGTDATSGKTTTVPIEAREIGYVPFATFVALVFAPALEWRRRRAILAGGLLLLGARLALAIGLPVAHFVGALTPGSAFDVAARVAFGALIEPPDMMYATPVVTFLLGLFLTRPLDGSVSAPTPAPELAPEEGG
jgi:hypothetical protein